MSDQERSNSRTHSPGRRRKKVTGFKWKEKRTRDDDSHDAERSGTGTLDRGYRNRSPHRYQRREDSLDRQDNGRRREHSREREGQKPRRRSVSPSRDRYHRRPVDGRPETESKNSEREAKPRSETVSDKTMDKDRKKDKAPKAPPISNEPMIVVNINDRLGTKAAIPCFASDSIKGFRAMVAAHIGRKPHEILLKRQGERPMKDILTLADYGVSNGVQLDLELDTGD